MGKRIMKTTEYNSLTAANAADRAAHFANGGTVGMWRGRAATYQDRKHVANKRACRTNRRED